MKYTVVWQAPALRRLAELWNDATDRAAIARAADAIDRLLGTDAAQQGEARSGNMRILFVGPLAVLYEVEELDRLASVFAVWRSSPAP